MSFSTSSISNSTLSSQTSFQYIQTFSDEELELEAEKEIFAQMFEAHYNTTSMIIQTVQESVVFKKTKKLRILKRKLRKLMREQQRRQKGAGSQGQEGSFSGTTQLNQFKYYPYYEGQYQEDEENKHEDIENSVWQPIPEPIINTDFSIMSMSSTQHSSSITNLNNVINVEIQKNTNINQNNNTNQINNASNQSEGVVKQAIKQYDPNEEYQRLQHQQQ
ncbi:unnamed protein product (macronuclear) [Paramecium tetraurelia]|uniref:Uncharacterized protein n=1 Tax=Paramecium tetraurelia TaxID=5888 RepID=A0BNE7_PARTE|nr:uncharacterized protein GSPATT00030702001 [Paramecium tetraurelia]CAK60064.1 unnamed protein product [Paramecium tetraurelia]|eukprot:XP_001427462.1 hypothetical protein (macronuclear) [Paramecium tetraurelia strain d4-2]